MNAQGRAHCAALSAWLRSLTLLGTWSLLVSAAALFALFFLPAKTSLLQAGLLLVIFLGVFERYIYLRCRLDAHLFTSLANAEIDSLESLDSALQRLGLRTTQASVHSLDERITGTLRLVKIYLLNSVIHTLMLIFCWMLI